jgi:polysaccharide pyruvyl transferase WcaK-like protein
MKVGEKKRKVAFFGPFGSTNFGNEATLQAILYHLRRYRPDIEVICISTGPEATATNYQIESIPISKKFFSYSPPRNPLLRSVLRVFTGMLSEFKGWADGLMSLRRTEMLIIPGTGLLTDGYGLGLTNWGPYGVFKWSLMAKICRCKLLFVSVGAGPIHSALGRFFVKSALSLADFRSYRDDATKQYLKRIGFRADNDRVYPDLVFSLPVTVIPHLANTKNGRRTVVGLGLMVCANMAPRPSNDVYQAYLENLAGFARWSITQEKDVRILIGELEDLPTTQAFRGLLREKFSVDDVEHVMDEQISSVIDLLRQIATTDIVVATRFHNVLFALLCGKPVISISFHHKCESLMSAMGLSEYCLDINSIKCDALIDKFCEMERNAGRLKPLISKRAREFRTLLNEQYRFIFNDEIAEKD